MSPVVCHRIQRDLPEHEVLLHLFSHYSSDPRLCQKDTVVYSINTTADGLSRVQPSVQQEVNPDVFCIQSANCAYIFLFK